MPAYYVNKRGKPTGEHEVHVSDCPRCPGPPNAVYLGEFDYCRPAVYRAGSYFDRVSGCAHCCPECSGT